MSKVVIQHFTDKPVIRGYFVYSISLCSVEEGTAEDGEKCDVIEREPSACRACIECVPSICRVYTDRVCTNVHRANTVHRRKG